MELFVQKYNIEGDIAHEYLPLRNLKTETNEICNFDTNEIQINLNHPLNIECQPSYDGTVNLILNDDINPPRIINSRFTVTENNRYKIINRNQTSQTNLYDVGKVDTQTRLFRNINNIPKIGLTHIGNHGQLKAGNYTFYIKFADNDYNQTDVVAESGNISIFKGSLTQVSSISGGLVDEATDKTITLYISNVDTSFSKMYLYYVRTTSDLNGFRITKAAQITKPYEIKSTTVSITINGYEDITEIDYNDLNIKYNLVTAVKTQAQVQNMLFFGNVQSSNVNVKELQNISLYIPVHIKQREDSIGYLSYDYKTKSGDSLSNTEYYNPLNTYYWLGYWPEEIYRLGIVYIMNDDSLSPVFNLRGCKFENIKESNFIYEYDKEKKNEKNSLYNKDGEVNYLPTDEFIPGEYLSNTRGVFCLPDDKKNPIINHNKKTVRPFYFQIDLPKDVIAELEKLKIKGYFIVRQKRIPITLAQGYSIGVDRISYTPMLRTTTTDDGKDEYISESFINSNGILSTDYQNRIIKTKHLQSSGLLCLDACVNPILQSTFDASEFTFEQVKSTTDLNRNGRHYYPDSMEHSEFKNTIKAKAAFVNTDIPLTYIDDCGFSTRAGASEEAKQIAFFGEKDYSKENRKILRGVFAPFLGLNKELENGAIYNIKSSNYSVAFEKEYFSIRGNDNSPFFAISDRYELTAKDTLDVYRGDCYTCTVTFRMQRNFVDPSVPTNELIVDLETWDKVYNGYDDTDIEKWTEINVADLNTVPIGTWVTFKVMSNYNLGLRANDRSNVEEMALMGNSRSFYPNTGISVGTSYKMNESWILNDGYNSTVGVKYNFTAPNVPYIKDLFDTRVMFSNVQVEDSFKNAYRIFQGLSYKDIDRQYGAIVKLLDWGTNLFCVFEHGLAILPINEKALIQSQTGQSIHMYGAGVLQNQVSLISSDFGSIWQDSIIRTPVAVYGVDTYNKKIWKYSDSLGLEIISDTYIQSYLNEHIKLSEKDKYPKLAIKNVKSHYNNHKGDVMFTFYNADEDVSWNICYNERLGKWITRYSWVPLVSENIDTTFVSMDKNRASLLSHVFDNKFPNLGLELKSNEFTLDPINLTPIGFDPMFKTFKYKVSDIIITSYLNDSEKEIQLSLDNTDQHLISITDDNRLKLSEHLLKYENNDLYYWKFTIEYCPCFINEENELTETTWLSQTIVIVVDRNTLNPEQKLIYDKLLRNGIYIHGRSGIFDEIDYNDDKSENQIKPTNWYDKQEPFEFEFVVNNLVGAHKIFDNLVIISNNVQPKELEFEIIGDVYDFNKMGIYRSKKGWEDEFARTDKSQEFNNVDITYDNVTNKYGLLINQECKNIKEYGRMKGNIHYKEDSWYVVIEPIKYRKTTKTGEKSDVNSTRIRDKFLKIRVKYSGEDLAIISSLKTLMTLSYA